MQLTAGTILVVSNTLRFRVADGDATFINPFAQGVTVLDNDSETRSSWVTLDTGTRLGFVGGSEQTNTFLFVLEGQDDRGRPSLGFGTGIVVRKMSMDKILSTTVVENSEEDVEVEGEVIELVTPEPGDLFGIPTLDEAAA